MFNNSTISFTKSYKSKKRQFKQSKTTWIVTTSDLFISMTGAESRQDN
jgi:hypothetical protein